MNATAEEPTLTAKDSGDRTNWSATRWAVCLAVAFAIHIGLIFAFGNRKPVVPRAVVNAPNLRIASERSELQVLADPTLFALPHPRGFAAAAWLRLPRVEFTPFRWTEPPQLLELPAARLGGAFLVFAQTNAVPKVDPETLTTIPATRVSASDRQSNLKQHSTVFASGGVSKRRWLNPPAVLRSWSAADLLTNSVVRVVVDADGLVFSTALLPPGSGSKAADQSALEMARSARFAPLPRHAKQMTGTLVFEWHTVPLAETNSPASKP